MIKMIGEKSRTDLAKGLAILADTQRATSVLVPKAEVEEGAGVTKEQVATALFCLVDEIGELAKEMGYKPWKPIVVNNNKVKDEFADVLAFLGLTIYYIEELTGMSVYELAESYYNKTETNIRRFIGREDGYAGVSNDENYARMLLSLMGKDGEDE